MRRQTRFSPLATRGRPAIVAILTTFAVFSVVSVGMSIWATSRSQNRASVVQVAARQRTLAERYVADVLLVRAGLRADPRYTGRVLEKSVGALLDGGSAPPVYGDDDETALPPMRDPVVRRQLLQQQRLLDDLTATGNAVLANRNLASVHLTAHEHLKATDPIQRLRVLAALTSNVSLNAARMIAAQTDRNVNQTILIQIGLGAVGLLVSLLLGIALIAATRRQTALFRSIVTSSTDLVLAFGPGGCRYVSESVTSMVGTEGKAMHGGGFEAFVHEDDRLALRSATTQGRPSEIVFRMVNRFGTFRHLEGTVTDLRSDHRVGGVVINARDVTERVRLQGELTRQAYHDSLTGLANRSLFRDRLDQALARAGRSGDRLAVVVLDLDGFKQVNDGLGHDAGDDLLKAVAERLAGAVRSVDTLARFGGDEFGVLFDGANAQLASALAERLLATLAEPVSVLGHDLVLGASAGVATHDGGSSSSDDLIRHADVAMYAAKEAGRGQVQVFRPEMARELGESLGLEHEMRLGLQNGEFSVHYQPEFDISTNAIVGCEALLRWTSPARGVVPPSVFIPVAETSNLILQLGSFVLDEACRQAAQWRADGLLADGCVIWVNVSARQLTAGGLEELVVDALNEAALPPAFLGLEVTETAVVEPGLPGERARQELHALHDRGVKIAIDDFGTGFSSLAQLRHFPVDVIKVDRSFVQGVEHDAKDAAISANVVGLAHALGLVAIAEGIESDSQLRSMRDLGCDLAQGYLFARPSPADEIGRLLAAAQSGRRKAA
jgi:diguanylate cyclase (GGDEF)-like protein/PAS domain S-box-containing protein